MIALLLALAAASPAAQRPPVLSAYSAHEDQVNACARYLESGDESHIAVDVGEGEIGTLECEDYPEAMPIVARRARERAFRAWYAALADRMNLDPNPDDKRHCFNYRAFFDGIRAGDPEAIIRSGGFMPKKFQTCAVNRDVATGLRQDELAELRQLKCGRKDAKDAELRKLLRCGK